MGRCGLAVDDCCVRVSAEDGAWSRAYRFDLYALVQVLGNDSTTGHSGTVVAEADTAPVYGVGMGVNLSEHLNLNGEVMLGWMDLEQTWPDSPGLVREDDNTPIWLCNLNLDYNILKGRFTPLVTGGIGAFGFNGDDFGEVNFSYNVGAGARWDITNHFALRVIYRSTWTEINHGDDPFQFDGVQASFIYSFK